MSKPPRQPHFADDLVLEIRRLGHPLCVGLDPHLSLIPPLFRRGSMRPGDPETAAAVESFLRAAVVRLEGKVAIVKPQIAFFEQLGWRGLRALEAVTDEARCRGLRVLLDAKRGDIGSTAAGYAAAYLGRDAPCQVDAITLNPFLGRDSLEPFLSAAKAAGAGVFTLVKTSNAGSDDYQGRRLESGGALYEHLAESLTARASEMRGEASGWSSLGVVVGATYPGESERVRERLPHSLFLVPGYGVQGGSAEDALRGFVRGPGGQLEGGVVNSSRGILFAAGEVGEARAWEAAFDAAVERAIAELSAVAAR